MAIMGVDLLESSGPACHYVDGMAWAIPQYKRSQVDRAAQAFMDPATSPGDREEARAVIDNWRSSHSFPLNTMQVTLRGRAAKVDSEALIAQRIKRLPSIQQKLIDRPRMRLTQMQDVGGCRAVVADLGRVDALLDLHMQSRSAHELVRHDDYIYEPKQSGYRSQHLVYRYKGKDKDTYDRMLIEVQVRTRLQHSWATAVETVGTFTRQGLKSSRGQSEWLRFFALCSSAFSYIEGTPNVPDTPTSRPELREELSRLAAELDVDHRLSAFAETLHLVDQPATTASKYFVLELDVAVDGAVLNVSGFRNQPAASEYFNGVERAGETNPGLDVVMVSVGQLTNLRRAYPNYYLDTAAFRENLTRFLALDI